MIVLAGSALELISHVVTQLIKSAQDLIYKGGLQHVVTEEETINLIYSINIIYASSTI